MKDPSIKEKEKAKLYDEATERAKKVLLDCTPEERKVVEYIHPGLAEDKEEDKDEMIRKHIIEILSSLSPCHFDGNEKSECIAWLEKQKTTEEALQYLKENHSPSEMSDFQSAMNIAVAKAYNKGYADGLEKQGGQKPADKVEPKFNVGDKINMINREEEDYTILTITSINMDEKCYICNQGSVIDFDEEREWYKIEPKPTWSEEDERLQQCLISDQEKCLEEVKNNKVGHSEIISDLKEMYRERIDWLKSLKARITPANKNDFDRGYEVGVSAAQFNQWKPTEEQLEALEWSLGDYRNVIFEERHDTLVSLYNDLKKL